MLYSLIHLFCIMLLVKDKEYRPRFLSSIRRKIIGLSARSPGLRPPLSSQQLYSLGQNHYIDLEKLMFKNPSPLTYLCGMVVKQSLLLERKLKRNKDRVLFYFLIPDSEYEQSHQRYIKYKQYFRNFCVLFVDLNLEIILGKTERHCFCLHFIKMK